MTFSPAPRPVRTPKDAKKSNNPRVVVPKRSGRIKPKKRSAAERARIYGPAERREWIRTQPCIACGEVGFSENAHTATEGMGRKAHYSMIVPLCGSLWSIVQNCHGELHRIGIKSFEEKYGVDLQKAAAETEAKWKSQSPHTGTP